MIHYANGGGQLIICKPIELTNYHFYSLIIYHPKCPTLSPVKVTLQKY